jgi:methylated-DNA-[protein]-cysteine S-methyltransferase
MQIGLRQQRSTLTDQTASELNEYFSGWRKHYDIPLVLRGLEFQKSVWKELCRIPSGEVRTYKEIAEAIGKPNSNRAIGMANN